MDRCQPVPGPDGAPPVLVVADVVNVDATQLVETLRQSSFAVTAATAATLRNSLTARPAPGCLVADLRHGSATSDVLDAYCQSVSRNVVVVTDIADTTARLHALALNVADHVVAPFEATEVVARVRAALGRSHEPRPTRVTAGDLTFDLVRRSVVRRGQHVDLTRREFAVLVALARATPRVVSKRDILEQVWGHASRTQNLVEATVSSLRRKLERTGPRIVHTVHGYGYSFRPTPPVTGDRGRIAAERERLVREREAIVSRRDHAIVVMREQLSQARQRVALDGAPTRDDQGADV